MKKRILSIILAFAMIMTMIPQTVFAETQTASDGYLAYRYSHYDNGYFVDYDEPLRTSCSIRKDMTVEVYFFYVEGDTETQILASEIYSSNEDIMEARDVDDYLVMLVPQDYGTTTINYEKDGKVYSISSEVQLQDYGYCTSPELTADSIVEKFSVAEVGDKLYFATRDGYQFDEVELLDEFQNIATAEISDDKTYITITFKAIPTNNEIYELGAGYVIDEGNSHHTIMPIRLFDGTPGLRYRYASWSEETESYYADPEEELNDSWNVEPNNRSSVIFYYIEKGVETEIPLEDLIISDSSVVSLSEEWGGGAFAIESLDFGHATIGYLKDGVEYTVDINVELPTIAFYTEPKASEDAYIQEFTVTKEKNTFYYVAKDGWTIREFEVQGSCQEYATVSLSEDKTYLTIQMDEEVPNGWFGVYGSVENEFEMEGRSASINIESGKAALVYKDVWFTGTGYEEDNIYCLDLYLNYDNGSIKHFYFKEGEDATEVLPSELTSADESIVVVEADEDYENLTHIRAVGVGETELLYEVDGVTYAIPVTVQLPDLGFYSSPEATGDTILNEFNLTENANAFYLVARNGFEITDITLEYDSDEFVTATISEDNTYVKLTVSDDSPSRMCYVSVTAYNKEYQYSTSDFLYIDINNNLPGLRLGYFYYEGDDVIESEAPLATSLEIEPGWSTLVGFYYFENGEKTLLKSSDVVISDENIVCFYQFRENENAVYLEALECGEATISYTVNGKTYSVKVSVDLPDFGFFSSPNASAETYIQDFIRYKEQDTFYFVARNGWKLVDIRVEDYFAEVADITIDPESGTFATIKIEEDIEDFYAYLSFDAINEELQDIVEDYGCGINIENGNPDLKFRYSAFEDGELIEVEEISYTNELWTLYGETEYVYLYLVENGEGARVNYNQVTSSDESVVKVKKCGLDNNATELEIVGVGSATINYKVNGVTYSLLVISEFPSVGFFSTTELKEETYIKEFEVTDTNRTFYFLAAEGYRFNNVELVGNAVDYAEIKMLENKQVVEITVSDDFEGEEYLEVDAVIDVPAYDYAYEDCFGITVHDGKSSEEPDDIDYAPYYDAETGTVKGIKVGDEVEVGTVFSAGNLEEGQILAFGYKAFETDFFFGYDRRIFDRGIYTVGEPAGNFDPADGWIVSSVDYIEQEDMIEIAMVSKVPPVQINPINISVDWSKLKDIKVGEAVPEKVEGINVTGKGVDCVWYAEVQFEVKPEHVEKGYITEDEYQDAINENGGWWFVSWLDDEFIASASDRLTVRVDVASEKGYVFAYSQDEQITGNIILYTDDIIVLRAGSYVGDYAGMAAEFYIQLGSVEQISAKANPVEILKGWQFIDSNWYYYDNDGKKVTNQWRKDSSGWCFLGEDGAMLTNQWVKDSVGYCFVDESGYMVYNQWCEDENGLAYAGSDGYRKSSTWIQDSKGWSYVDETGYKVYSTWVSGCYIDDTGYMAANKWIETADGWCYMGANGYKTTNQWVQRAGKWVYLGANGYAVTKQWVKDSTGWCYVDEKGFMVYDQWVADSKGLCYVGKTGYMVTNQWIETEDGWCYVGSDGYKVTNKWVKDSKGWCYLDEDGYMLYNQWVADSTGFCYVGADGYMVTNEWRETENGWCYIGSNGYMTTDSWMKKSGEWYYLGSDGYIVTNDWAKDGSRWCYLDENGHMTKDTWINDDSGSRYLDANGYMAVNQWFKLDNEWVYVGSNGYMLKNAWAKDSVGWCYLDANGHMVCNDWVPDSKGEVYLGSNGYMVTNKWIKVGDQWCYVGSDGYKVTNQWRQDSSGWCYLGADGFMLTSQWVKDSVGYCYVDEGGYIVYSQFVNIGEDRYYVNSSGYRVENKWVKIDGSEYYFKEGGVMARDEKIDGYYVDENGVYIPGV